jgi:hypothetical protein
MAHDKKQRVRDIRKQLRGEISRAVAEAFPDFTAEFCGDVERSRMATRGQTLGFRLKDSRGRYRSNIIWLNASYDGSVSAAWVADAVKQSNG